MTNQDRALAIMAKLYEAEKAGLKLPASERKTDMLNALSALHAELQTHASAMADELELDIGALSFGGNKN